MQNFNKIWTFLAIYLLFITKQKILTDIENVFYAILKLIFLMTTQIFYDTFQTKINNVI